MTCLELSTAVRHGYNPIVVVLNNKGYTTERFLQEGPFNDILNWNYHRLPDLLGKGWGFEVKSNGELKQAMQAALAHLDSFSILNVHLQSTDVSPALRGSRNECPRRSNRRRGRRPTQRRSSRDPRLKTAIRPRSTRLILPAMNSADRLVSIDVLRGVAGLAVLLRHVLHFGNLPDRSSHRAAAWLMDLGYLGVPLFIVISGFCIHRRAARHGLDSVRWTTFWKRRFWRLYPPYLAAMALSVTIGFWLVPGLLPTRDLLGQDFLVHLVMIQNLLPQHLGGMANGAFWSLGMEEQLYALYAILLAVRRRSGWSVALLMVSAVAFAWCFQIVLNGEDLPGLFHLNLWWFYPFFWWLLWTLGALAVEISTGRARNVPDWTASPRIMALLGGLALLTNRETAHELVARFPRLNGDAAQLLYLGSEILAGLFFFTLLNWLVHRDSHGRPPGPISRTLAAIGAMSYSLYLTHIPVIALIATYGLPSQSWILLIAQSCTASLAVAAVFYQIIETPFINRHSHSLSGSSSNTPR